MTTRRIDEIVVGERHRRDLGDIDLADLGLLQPIVIRPDDRLLVGHRRLASRQGAWLYRDSGQRGRSRRHGERPVRRERPRQGLHLVGSRRHEASARGDRAAAKERQHDHAGPLRGETPEKQTCALVA